MKSIETAARNIAVRQDHDVCQTSTNGRVCGHTIGQHELRAGGRLGCIISGCLCIDYERHADAVVEVHHHAMRMSDAVALCDGSNGDQVELSHDIEKVTCVECRRVLGWGPL